MRKNNIRITALAFVIPILFLWPVPVHERKLRRLPIRSWLLSTSI